MTAKPKKSNSTLSPWTFESPRLGQAGYQSRRVRPRTFRPHKARNRIKVLYWERNGFCLWLKRLEAER
ncbi:TPA: IS66 family insertion sequence element accessory protein TnpB, partial [Pseudomonas putida]|nr:IS66 family insertion sequence element accessory protein TnpB [Pseudomonas putida]